jgi:hypothetical protein
MRYALQGKEVFFKAKVYQVDTRAVVAEENLSGDVREFNRLVFQIATRFHRKITNQWAPSTALDKTDSALRTAGGSYVEVSDLLAASDDRIKIVLNLDRGEGAAYKPGEIMSVNYWIESKGLQETPCYLTLLDVSPCGKVSLLLPNKSDRETKTIIGRGYRFPSSSATFDFAAGCEPGEELLVAVASTEGLKFINRDIHKARSTLLPLIDQSFFGFVKDRILPELSKKKYTYAVARYFVEY